MTEKSTDIRSRYVNFLDEVYLCGVKEYTRSTLRCIKIGWVILVCIGIWATGYYLFNMVQEFVQSPLATKMEFNLTQFYDYPNIVLCPDKWIDYDSFERLNISRNAVEFGLGHIYSLEKETYLVNVSDVGQQEFLHYIQLHSISDYRDLYELIAKPGDRFVSGSTNKQSGTSVNVTKLFSGFQVCYQIHFDKLDCSKQTVNRAPTVDILFPNSDQTEVDNEFDLIRYGYQRLYVNPDLKLITDTTPNKILLEAGKTYSLSIFPKKYFSLDKRQQHCVDTSKRNDYYSQPFCSADCMQRYYSQIYERCVYANLITRQEARQPIATAEISYCNVLNRKQPAVRKNYTQFIQAAQKCAPLCLPACEHALVEIMVSHAQTQTFASNPDSATTTMFKGNKSILQILYDVCDKGIMEIREYERYTFENLLSDIGGVLGLWISASAVTFVQVLMCLVEMGMLKLRSHQRTTVVAEPLVMEKF